MKHLSELTRMFYKGDIVWAQANQSPVWPAVIASELKNSFYRVTFIGEKTQATVIISDIYHFDSKKTEFTRRNKDQKFLRAVRLAEERQLKTLPYKLRERPKAKKITAKFIYQSKQRTAKIKEKLRKKQTKRSQRVRMPEGQKRKKIIKLKNKQPPRVPKKKEKIQQEDKDDKILQKMPPWPQKPADPEISQSAIPRLGNDNIFFEELSDPEAFRLLNQALKDLSIHNKSLSLPESPQPLNEHDPIGSRSLLHAPINPPSIQISPIFLKDLRDKINRIRYRPTDLSVLNQRIILKEIIEALENPQLTPLTLLETGLSNLTSCILQKLEMIGPQGKPEDQLQINMLRQVFNRRKAQLLTEFTEKKKGSMDLEN